MKSDLCEPIELDAANRSNLRLEPTNSYLIFAIDGIDYDE